MFNCFDFVERTKFNEIFVRHCWLFWCSKNLLLSSSPSTPGSPSCWIWCHSATYACSSRVAHWLLQRRARCMVSQLRQLNHLCVSRKRQLGWFFSSDHATTWRVRYSSACWCMLHTVETVRRIFQTSYRVSDQHHTDPDYALLTPMTTSSRDATQSSENDHSRTLDH